ncbi:MAG: DUF1338 domain-containing protein [Bacteroidetes bacterium]|nr:DUF1338 domain-containing protein [Bacteroidota bacterium]
MEYKAIFNKLWEGYINDNPHAKKIYDLFEADGESVINDHIAFRTFNDTRINIDILAKVFIANGFKEQNTYRFENKHLFAKHFEHKSDALAPRVFISEIILEDFSFEFQQIIKSEIDKIDTAKLNTDELIYAGNIWSKPSFGIYEKLKQESEYAAWLYVFGFRANHFTVSVNHLKKYDSIEKVNSFLKNHDFLINSVEGEIKGSPAELLEQSSIKSGIISVEFIEGNFEIPSCYYEFAKRYKDTDGKLYSGFIAKSADKIFESTDYYKRQLITKIPI